MTDVGVVVVEGREDERAAAREASDCGAIETTGICGFSDVLLASRKFSTSVCDWSVMRTDSAEVMHPLQGGQHSDET